MPRFSQIWLMTQFLTMPSFARRLLFCISTYRLTDRHVSIMVKGQHITEVMLLVHQWVFLHSGSASLLKYMVWKQEKTCKFLWQKFPCLSRKKPTLPRDVQFCIFENIRSIIIELTLNVCSQFFHFIHSHAKSVFCATLVQLQMWKSVESVIS